MLINIEALEDPNTYYISSDSDLSGVAIAALSYKVSSDKELLHIENLITFLAEKNTRFEQINFLASQYSLETYQLLISNGISPDIVLRQAIGLPLGEGRDNLIDLALLHNPDLSVIYITYSETTENLEKYIAYGYDQNRAASQLLSASLWNESQTEAVENLLNFLIAKGARFDDHIYISSNLSYSCYVQLLDKGLKANIVLSKALVLQEGLARDNLIDLALSYNPNLSYVRLSFADRAENLAKYLAKGLSLDNAVRSLLTMSVWSDEQNQRVETLLDYLVQQGAQFDHISFVHPTLSSPKIYQLMLGNGLSGDLALDNALSMPQGEIHDELLSLVLKYDYSPDKINLSVYNTKSDLDKIIGAGVAVNKVINLLSNISPSNDHEKEYVEDLLKYLVEKAIKSFGEHTLSISTIKSIYDILHNMKNPISADQLLLLLINSYTEKAQEHKSKINLIEKTIDSGANIDQEIFFGLTDITLLEYIQDPAIRDILIRHGAKICGLPSQRVKDMFEQENIISLVEQKHNFDAKVEENLSKSTSYINTIPHILHHIWFTSPDSPREISDSDMENIINNQQIIGVNVKNLQHIVWTNNIDLIPLSRAKLEKNNIELRSIENYQNEFDLYKDIQNFIEQKLWGMASDLARYSVVEKFGGIYSDLNFQFTRSFEQDIHKYDFIAQSAINNFFAAKPNHPIMKGLIAMIKNNLEIIPSYIANIPEKAHFVKTAYISLIPFVVSVLRNAHLDENIDVIFSTSNIDYSGKTSVYGYLYNKFSYNNYFYYHHGSSCHSIWDIIGLGGHVIEYLTIGVDGYNNSYLTWLEE